MGGVKKRLLDNRRQLELAREAKKRKRESKNEENAREDGSQASTSGTTATPSSSAKRRREELGSMSPATRKPVSDENILLKKSYIEDMFTRVACKQCYAEKLKVHFVNKHLDFKFLLEWQNAKSK